MAAEAEVLQVVHEVLQELQVGQYTIKLNHRLLLDAMMRVRYQLPAFTPAL